MRALCVFAQHNILRDPPFSRLDFISCCNLFIYLDSEAQKKAVNTYHYALNNDGFLMLGKAENISQSANLFTISDNKYKIFSRKINSSSQRLPELSPRLAQQNVTKKNVPLVQRNKAQQNFVANHLVLDNAIDAVLVSDFMPASVVINHQMEIVQFRGTTDSFLTHPKGKATFNILKMARPELAFELRNTISKVIKTKQRIRKSGIELKINSAVRIVSLEIVPLAIEWNEPLLLVLFTEQEQTEIYSHQANGGKHNSLAKDRRITKLEQELATAHSDALATSHEQEAFSEELQSANEEVVSSNEELQTINKELETSAEEIESANEELTTTNQELQTRNDLLNESYEYSDAIISTMHEPFVVLGKDLRVKFANPAFYKKFRVTEEETEGVLLYDLGNKQWNIPALRELLEDIIPKNSTFHEYEVKQTFLNIGEKIMLLNASRVIQKVHREQLILLVIADITEVRHLLIEKELKEKEQKEKEADDHKRLSALLEETVKQRTRDLIKSNLDLENKNKELEAFTFISSHDLQEPLRKIQTFASRILEKENKNLSDNGKNYFRLMQQSAERMRQLIKDLLSFSRITAAERKFENTDLNIIIKEVKEDFKEELKEKHATIEVAHLCQANIIPFQFRQMMYNLIENALKFSTPEKPPHIKIKSHIAKGIKLNNKKLFPQKQYCHLSVTDNGIGFEPRYSEKIFEVFQHLHPKDKYEGTGIGLAIVKKIVENHQGIITAHSKLGKGAQFDIYIPA